MPRFQPEDVRADLLYLRKGNGYTPQRLASRPALVSILGGGTNSAHEPQPVLKERLISAICSLHDEDATLLLEIFNLDPPTTNHQHHLGGTAQRSRTPTRDRSGSGC